MNMKKISGIHVLIWDFDGTLYRSIPELTKDILEADYEVVMRHKGWDRKKTIEEFHKIYNVRTPSSTETAAMLSEISVKEAARECELYKDRKKYLTRDDALIALFAKLSRYTHYILANGVQEKIKESLATLGLSETIFRKIVTAEVVGVNKPQPQGFQYIIQKTGLPPKAHMMIGDREAVDLMPAKALGMRTCLVGSTASGVIADVTVSTVYACADMIG